MPEINETAAYALEFARDLLPDSSTPDQVTAAAKKVVAFLNGDETTVDSTIKATAVIEEKKLSFARAEYNNRKGSGTHWGKAYKTLKGANKNSKNPAFIRAVEFKEV